MLSGGCCMLHVPHAVGVVGRHAELVWLRRRKRGSLRSRDGRAMIACLQIFAQLAELRPAGALSRNFAALLGVSSSSAAPFLTALTRSGCAAGRRAAAVRLAWMRRPALGSPHATSAPGLDSLQRRTAACREHCQGADGAECVGCGDAATAYVFFVAFYFVRPTGIVSAAACGGVTRPTDG